MKVLAVATHPDDETLGCGGTLLKHSANDDELYWLIITGISQELGYTEEFISRRREEIDKVVQEFKMDEVFQLDFPANKLDEIPLNQIISKISEVFKRVKPELIYLPNRSDVHSDHRITFEAVASCTKSFRFPYIKRVLMYETISETEFALPGQDRPFQPNSFCDISNHLEKKLDILEIYQSEIDKHPFPRSKKNVKALANFRGATAGVEYAEAFMILKDIF
jgi:LmbE family N-acetylglucosaminyl deacetylase